MTGSLPHKARRRGPKKPSPTSSQTTIVHVTSSTKGDAVAKAPLFPLASFMWAARGSASEWEVLPLILMVVGLFRWAAGLWGYSGYHRGPLFGDYEAQRNWMEVTTQVPVSQWYFHDLQHWGVGTTPPLTAYHSWLAEKLDTDAFYYPLVEQLLQMVHRIFPFARGLFEDKVANFWCALNVVVKLRNFAPELQQRAALALTLASIIPANLVLFFRPRKHLLPLGFAATAWGFFLFSFQVHEKSVLLPLMPMTLLLAGKQGLSRDTRAWVGFANILGAWTMFPLLQRVDLRVPYAVLTLLWAYLLGLPPTSLSAYFQEGQSAWVQWGTALVHGVFYIAMAAWHVVEATVRPPIDKPDLWTVANVGVGCVGFGLCYLWCMWQLFAQSGQLPVKASSKSKKKSY
ncbi:dolichyl pyrophosphate Man9GlcNAc2 alpha-1,3-glucosyltransferase [Verticillium alfalfae VaMs.102]|uniref:Alpha-1,3-glucosyltransferase n=1 Tax=Verticillium alfalfae (strain VaMs.102 / ATCC MYA-4576 / FGSC 10136) TaxID=526221 RepID=C9SI43_VERA1|nr:dolichyl pyrophosphate Man9GlcNAc2 alpha-1,3-glucosyltransferase [Verticillium alfalfae VaMs.102]EEY18616.1 dolichyl pyrophosphate Man9GlcNAc2 alpha-1,3-glucosyltransferase [Verticillium alfalfae VaMs.102]